MKEKKFTAIHADGAPPPVGAYPHARRAGEFVYLSGIGPRMPGTDKIPGNQYDESGRLTDYDIEQQCHSVFKNVQTIIEASGCRWEELVDVTVFLTDMHRDFSPMNRLYAEYFSGHQPCRTTVEVGALPTDIAIELKCVLHAPR